MRRDWSESISLLFYGLFFILLPLLVSGSTTDPIVIKTFFAEGLFALYLCFSIIKKIGAKEKFVLRISLPFVIMFCWIAWELLGCLFYTVKEPNGERMRLIMTLCALLLIVNFDFDFIQKYRKIILYSSIGTAAVIALVTLAQHFDNFIKPYEYLFVLPSGTLGSHNLLSAYMLLQTGLLFACFPLAGSTLKKGIWFFTLLLLIFAVFVSKSRSGMVSIIFMSGLFLIPVSVYLLFFHRRRSIRRKLLIFAGTIALMVAGLTAGGALLKSKNISIEGKQDPVVSIYEKRLPIYESTLAMAKVHPLKGWGTGSFRSVFPAFKDEKLQGMIHIPTKDWAITGSKTGIIGHAHNEFLEILSERGVIGLLLFMLFWTVLFYYAFRRIREEKREQKLLIAGISVALAAVLLQNMVTVTLRFPVTLLFTFFFAQIVVLRQKSKTISFVIQPKIALAVVPLVVCVCSMMLYNTSCRYESDILLQKSLVQINTKRPQRALVFIMQAEKLNPDNPDVHYKKGYIHYLLENYPEAISSYTKALSLEPNFAGAHYNLGCALYKLKKYSRAENEFQRSIHLDPNNTRSLHYLAKICFLKQDYKKALTYSKKVVGLTNRDGEMGRMYNALVEAGI